MGRMMGLEPTNTGTTNRGLNHLATPATKKRSAFKCGYCSEGMAIRQAPFSGPGKPPWGLACCCAMICRMTTPHSLHTVVLTGKRDAHGPLLNGTGLHNKMLLPVAGVPMLRYVLEALAGCRFVSNVFLSTSDPEIAAFASPVPFQVLPSQEHAVQSLLSAVQALPPSHWALFVSGDHALLTAEMLEHFLEEGMRQNRALSVAVVARSVVEAAYPQSVRTYFEARAEAYSGGNLFLINRQKFRPNSRFMETMDRNRKQPWKNAFMLNPVAMLQILFKRLNIHQVAEKASEVLGCSAGVVEMPFAECCMDVDKPSDLVLAEQILTTRRLAALPLEIPA